MISKLRRGGVLFPDYVSRTSGGFLAGKSFVITGRLSKPRVHFKKIVVENGGIVVGSVSGATAYLLCGSEPGSKLKKAEKLGITILNESQFTELIKE